MFDKFLLVNQNKIPRDFEHENNVYGNTLSSCSKSYGVSFRYKHVICFDMCKNNSDSCWNSSGWLLSFYALLTHHIVRTLVAEDEVFATRKTHKLYENSARLQEDGSNRRKYNSRVFVPTRALMASVITSD